MKKLVLFAAVAGFGLVSASPPEGDHKVEARGDYPPCSATVTDECIQLYERGVRRHANGRIGRRPVPPRSRPAAGGAIRPAPRPARTSAGSSARSPGASGWPANAAERNRPDRRFVLPTD